jgi:tetratricopeptide repeat protein 21B
MINLLRKAGRLEEAPSYLTAAEQGNRRSGSHAGLRYCQGLHARYTNDVGKAISEFNLARRDEVWGHDALVHMIELFLNPDQDGAWEEGAGAEGGEGGSAGNSRQIDDAVADNISAAKTLLKELKPITR